MPRKIDPDAKYGVKIIKLFAELLFAHRKHSLIELADKLQCSKQTVQRLVDNIEEGYSVEIEGTFSGRRKYYELKKGRNRNPLLPVTESEMGVLLMCRAFTSHLLGGPLFEEAAQALQKTQAQLPDDKQISTSHFASYIPGTIDYSQHHHIIQSIIRAMEEKRVCKVTYQRIMADEEKTYYIKPLKLFSHKDSIYLHTRKAKSPQKRYREPDYDPLLAVHRISDIEVTDRQFEFPNEYDFEKAFNKHFGIIKGEPFKAEVEFSGWAARFVSERTWSPDQKIVKKRNGTISLTFTVSSEPELMGWILNFAEEARVIKPAWLVDDVKNTIGLMAGVYGK